GKCSADLHLAWNLIYLVDCFGQGRSKFFGSSCRYLDLVCRAAGFCQFIGLGRPLAARPAGSWTIYKTGCLYHDYGFMRKCDSSAFIWMDGRPIQCTIRIL